MRINYKIAIYILIAFWVGYEARNHTIIAAGQFIEKVFLSLGKPPSNRALENVRVFSDVSLRKKAPCPEPGNAYVIIGFGQSNSANYAGHRFENNNNVLNYFNGNCYLATDPLLGATGLNGSVWLPLTRRLDVGERTIVLATFGVGSTKIGNWLDRNYLYPFYKENLAMLKSTYAFPNAAVWIQGESDNSTPTHEFENKLTKWLNILSTDLPDTTLYITGTSYCRGNSNQSILEVQERISESFNVIYAGNTDFLKAKKYRYDDCHFSEQGINALADLIGRSWIN